MFPLSSRGHVDEFSSPLHPKCGVRQVVLFWVRDNDQGWLPCVISSSQRTRIAVWGTSVVGLVRVELCD